MFIVPLTSSITPMETMSQKKQTESTDDGEATFFDVFESLVKNVKETDAQVQKDSVDLMLGDVDDLAQIQVNLEKALPLWICLLLSRTRLLTHTTR